MNSLTLIRPDDWHIHLRDQAALQRTVKDAARCFARAIVMPNLNPPVSTTESALAYRQRILDARNTVAANSSFEPLMTLYLTDNTSTEEIVRAKASGHIHAAKLYPAGATTHSDAGVTAVKKIYPVLEAMQKAGMPLLVHGEVTDDKIDLFDREKVFLDQQLRPIARDFPALKIVMEHITTGDAVDFITAASKSIAATITAHHLLYNRNHLLVGGIKPHYYCLPVLKRNSHQQALIEAAISGNPKFFLGTDSAPHARTAKEAACGCAGCYTAHAAIELYAEVFSKADALHKLEGFASLFGADFYGLPHNRDTITLTQQPWAVAEELPFSDETLIPMRAGGNVLWQICDEPQ